MLNVAGRGGVFRVGLDREAAMDMTRDDSAGRGNRRDPRWQGALRHRALGLGGLAGVALLAAACSSSSTGSSSGAAASPSSTGSTGTVAVVKVLSVPTYGRILTNGGGMPLYTLSGTCTGSCASAWPALTVPAGTTPTGGAGVTGTLTAVKQADGAYQVMYDGSPLYTFFQDSAGHVTGQGVSGFSVVKVSGSSTSTTSTSTGARY
jgi:predicted lipoprotein with Yx(FWY)xxD motif